MGRVKYTPIYNADTHKEICRYIPLEIGWFYKGKYYKSDMAVFKALVKNDEARTVRFPNGYYSYKGTAYASLKEIWEKYEDDFGIPWGAFSKCYGYREYGVDHCEIRVMYQFDADEDCRLFDNLWEMLTELKWETCEKVINTAEDVECDYINDLPDDELIKFCKHNLKERVEILERWLQQNAKTE